MILKYELYVDGGLMYVTDEEKRDEAHDLLVENYSDSIIMTKRVREEIIRIDDPDKGRILPEELEDYIEE